MTSNLMPIVLTPLALLAWLVLLGWWIRGIDNPGPVRRKMRMACNACRVRARRGFARVEQGSRRLAPVVPSGKMGWKIGKGGIVLIVLAGALYASTRAAVPDPLPGVAMGWTALFHVERAGALLGAMGIVALIGWRALSGEFPIKFGNVEYAAKEAAAEAEEISVSQERRIRVMEVLMGIRDQASLENDR
jgi:hypothetical protein